MRLDKNKDRIKALQEVTDYEGLSFPPPECTGSNVKLGLRK